MIVTPQSNVRILKSIPWNIDRKHVRLFDGSNPKQQQYDYMISHQKYAFSDFTYVREQKAIRVPVTLDSLVDCNYLMFQNRGFGNKWFYAFITDRKFYNSEMSEVSFELDDFNTWFYDCVVPNCYVEREHVADDTIGAHTLEEDLGTGELVPQETYNRFWDDAPLSEHTWGRGFKLALQLKPSLVGSLLVGDGVEWEESQIVPVTDTFEINDATYLPTIQSFLRNYSHTGYEINKGYMYPIEFEDGAKNVDVSGNGIKRPNSFRYYYKETTQAYTPKNNKLLTYPYTKLVVSTHEGKSKEFRWENTITGQVNFKLISVVNNNPSCSLYPTNYLGGTDSVKLCNTDALTINEFPEVNLGKFDSMKPENFANAFSHLASIIGTVSSLTGLVTNTADKANATTDGNLALKYRHLGYTFQVMAIKAENAQIIDSYLTRFGYKVNTIKVPELYSRRYWNFVKTKEIDISGNIPAESAQVINDMFNSGVTFWHINNVGDFSGDNSIVQ